MSLRARWLVAIAAVVMTAAYVLPLWRVDLIAPQYPEGLGMYITISGVEGLKPNDLNSINGLNHYIGMRPIVPESIPELRWMPWILGVFAAGGLAVAAVGRRRVLHAYAGLLFLLFAVGLWDFWRWGYDYGHNLDEEKAIIKVPGMTYQPPLIGSKKLLNFRATSWPSSGGVALIIAGSLVGLAVLDTRRKATLALLALAPAACGAVEPRALQLGDEACTYCRMVITDERFGGQVITKTGRQMVFDGTECLVSYLATNDDVAGVWVMDAERPGTWTVAEHAGYLLDASVRGPMSRLTAFASPEAAMRAREQMGGAVISWNAVRTDSAGIHARHAGD